MEILQLPIADLQAKIEEALQENPFLELKEKHGEQDEQAPEFNPDAPLKHDETGDLEFNRLDELNRDWEDHFNEEHRPSRNSLDEEGDRKHDAMQNMPSRPQSLQDYLIEQFGFFSCPPEIREFAEFLIQNLDGNGRLPNSLEEMTQTFCHNSGKTISPDDALAALSMIQRLEPRGVGARDLKECFLLQIGPNPPLRDVLITLITSHLVDLAENRLPVIERKTGYSLDIIKEAREELLHLNPRPGRDFEVAPAPNVVPDISIEQDATGKYVVRLEDEYTPRLNISRKYQQLLANGQADQKTKDYIKRKIEAARWLIESIEQRYNTLKRVAQAIVDHQTAFLDKGPEHIVPLKMQQIADVVGVHVTTVSRAVDDKYVQTPRGIFALKRFFGGGTTTAGGDEVAWDIIRIKLKEIVDKEDKNDPLSDDALVDELAKQGYKLARRTITKYRKALKIPSSRQRRAY
jgi:RNA polymerase sigma-54 factor